MSFGLSKKSHNLNQYTLLSNLEDCVEQLKASTDAIKDDNLPLQSFCATFEQILLEGARRSVLVFKQKHYWNWISGIPKFLQNCGSNDPKLAYIVNTVDSSTKIWPIETKGRLFIRMALVKKCLHSPVEVLNNNRSLLQNFYTDGSFLGTAHLQESLLEHLQEISKLDFDLNLKAVEFLNESWEIPKREDVLTVPCTQLGITVSQVEGRAVIAHVLPDSVGEENNMAVGDCLLNLCGKVCWGQKVGQVADTLKQNHGQPISLILAKVKKSNGQLFLPLEQRKKLLESEEFFLQKYQEKNGGCKQAITSCNVTSFNETPVHGVSKGKKLNPYDPDYSRFLKNYFQVYKNAAGNLCFEAKYIGKNKTGETGDLNYIEPSILTVVDQKNEPLAVLVKLGETSIEIQDKETNKTLAIHSYTVTSACGRGKVNQSIFAYISGDTTCTISKNFTCYVFTVDSEAQAKQAVYGIAQGFNRTLWYV